MTLFVKKKDGKKIFKFQLSIVSIAKNEGPYIKEWVEYHLKQGVDCIYLYDNDSTDNMREILDSYIRSGEVIYTIFPGRARQFDAYNDAIRRFKNETKYMAFIDYDEFLVPEDKKLSLIDTIEMIMKKDKHSGGIAVNWRMYGSSGHESKPKGGVLENFVYRGDYKARGSDCVKTIANPRTIWKYAHPHFPRYRFGYYNINEKGERVKGWSNKCGDTEWIRINHYFTKSKEEWIKRRSQGQVDRKDRNDIRTIDEFYEHDHNQVYDPIAFQYMTNTK